MGESQRALAIGAHPDDTEFGCYGVIQRFESRSVLVLSVGEHGGPPVQRRDEAAEAAAAVGADLRVGDLPDTAIARGPAIAAVRAEIDRLRPDVVFCPSRNDDHQDHAAVADATFVATRGFTGVLLAYLTPSAAARFAPQAIFPLTDDEWRRKRQALAAHRSQSHRSYLADEYLEATARYWALAAGDSATRAEPFEVLRWVQAPPVAE